MEEGESTRLEDSQPQCQYSERFPKQLPWRQSLAGGQRSRGRYRDRPDPGRHGDDGRGLESLDRGASPSAYWLKSGEPTRSSRILCRRRCAPNSPNSPSTSFLNQREWAMTTGARRSPTMALYGDGFASEHISSVGPRTSSSSLRGAGISATTVWASIEWSASARSTSTSRSQRQQPV